MRTSKVCNVLLPVYNGEKFVCATIESVLAQDYPDVRLIIIDDDSSDNSRNIAKEYQERFPDKILYIENKNNLGVGMTLYRAYKQEHDAAYFAMIGHDDIWPYNYLSMQIEALEREGALVSFAKVHFINHNEEEISNDTLFFHNRLEQYRQEEVFVQLIARNFLCAPASVVNLQKIDKEEVCSYWGYNNDKLQDYELWLNLSMRGRFIYNDKIFVNYRIHGNNLSDETKRVLQGKMEYYSTLHRVLFSENFWGFLKSRKDPEEILNKILDNIYLNLSFSNPCKILMIDLCERALNEGYYSEKIDDYLNWLYMDSGIITKCLKNGRKLPAKIPVVLCGEIKEKQSLQTILENDNFTIETDINSITPHGFCLTQPDNLEYLLNNPAFFRNIIHGQVIVICNENDKIEELQEKFPNILIVESQIAKQKLDKLIYSFAEDHTHIWRNGFFDMLTSYTVPDLKVNNIIIKLKEESIRKIEFLDYLPSSVSYYSTKEMLKVLVDNSLQVLFEENHIQDGKLYLKSKSGFDIKTRIVVNNKLFLCDSVVKNEFGELALNYSEVSYFNNVTRINEFFSIDIFDLLNQYYGVTTAYRNMTNSTFYKYYVKIRKVLIRFKLEKAAKKFMNLCEKFYSRFLNK